MPPELPDPSSSALAQPASLASAARDIVLTPDPADKVRLSKTVAKAWFQKRLSIGLAHEARLMPERPGRPLKPALLAPRDMPRRSTSGLAGRIALIHALAHIELNAVDMTWDLIGRFYTAQVPRSFLDNWVQVALEEAKHFELLGQRLHELGAAYGDLPAHDGLWQSAQATGHDLMARVAILPLVLEARGLDVQPAMIEGARRHGDERTAAIFEIIYRDEKRHVAIGAKWFRFLCDQRSLAPEPTFHALVRAHFRGTIRPPFNDKARSEAGLAPGFYKPLVSSGLKA